MIESLLGPFPHELPTSPISIEPLQNRFCDCVTHIVDLDQIIDHSTASHPLILTTNVASEDAIVHKSYHLAFRGVLSYTCLVTILTINAVNILSAERGNMALSRLFEQSEDIRQIYSQTLVILKPRSQNSVLEHFWYMQKHWPQVFLLYHEISGPNRAFINGELKCWYCGDSSIPSMRLGKSSEFSCENLDLCISEMDKSSKEHMPTGSGVIGKWYLDTTNGRSSAKSSLQGNGSPFSRERPVSEAEAVIGFLYANISLERRFMVPRGYPTFAAIDTQWLQSISMPAGPKGLIYTGKTPRVKFITAADAHSRKNSHKVYFAPFALAVWLALIFSILASSLAVGVFTAVVNGGTGRCNLVSVTAELIMWKLMLMIGQCKDMVGPKVWPSVRYRRGIAISVALWMVASTALANTYQAIFSSDSTQNFPYRTPWEKLIELGNNFTVFLLVSDTLKCGEMFRQFAVPLQQQRGFHAAIICNARGYSYGNAQLKFPECSTFATIDSLYTEISIQNEASRGVKGSGHKANKFKGNLIRSLWSKSNLLCGSEENIEFNANPMRMDGRKVAFVTYEHEFAYYWNKFNILMKRYPSWRFGNNFDADDDFGVNGKGFMFTDGMRPEQRNPFVGRLKVLLSSGIYALWERWERIKFSKSGIRNENDMKKVAGVAVGGMSPLAFENSGTPWLVAGLMTTLAIAVCVFLVELLFFLGYYLPK